jgi:hypothetical protein
MTTFSYPKLADAQWPRPEDPPVVDWAADLSYPNFTNFAQHFALYNEMVDWIRRNVVNYQHNALWTKIGDCIYIKLRKHHDATVFILKFGPGNSD